MIRAWAPRLLKLSIPHGAFGSHRSFVKPADNYLANERSIYISGKITRSSANIVIKKLMKLDCEEKETITLIINSEGGLVPSGLAIYDTMQQIASPVSTICLGEAASTASLLLAAGAPGMRRAFPNSRVMIHDLPIPKISGSVVQLVNHAEELRRLRDMMIQIYSKHSGQPLRVIQTFFNEDTFFSPQDAVKYGLIDTIITHRK